MSLANSFSGGLFLSICLIHILPEAAGDYLEWVHRDDPPANAYIVLTSFKRLMRKLSLNAHKLGDDEKDPFPLPYVLAFAGYTLILLFDKVIFDTHKLFGGTAGAHSHKSEGTPLEDTH